MESFDRNVPAIASDVCERPPGTILFKSENIDDLIGKVKSLDSMSKEESIAGYVSIDCREELIQLYQSLIN
jgi:hypothetical protein